MTPPLRDFVSTYRPPIQPEPFFGFFEDEPPPIRKRRSSGKYYRNKLARNKRATERKPFITKRYNRYYDHNVLGAKPKNYKIKAA